MIISILLTLLTVTSATRLCRDRTGVSLPQSTYNSWTCAKCFEYLFPRKNIIASFPHFLVSKDDMTSLHPGTVKKMKVLESGDRRRICRTLTSDQCLRWRSCCRGATKCCSSKKLRDVNKVYKPGYNNCPATWDGYACWTETEPGTVSHTKCPSFIPYSLPNRLAVKKCGRDGRWASRADLEWTDYSSCLNRRGLQMTVYAAMSLSSLSIVMLLVAIFIVIFNSEIRASRQTSVHVNVYVSLILLHISTMLWEWFVTHDRLSTSDLLHTRLHKNDVICKAMKLTVVYLQGTAYTWLLAHTCHFRQFVASHFSYKQSVLTYYILAWGLPLVTSGVYCGLRVAFKDASCWSEDFGMYKWTECSPNVFYLAFSLVCLLDGVRLLFAKANIVSNEPKYVRRSCFLKGALLCVYAVQSAVSIFSLTPAINGHTTYEHFTVFVNNSQGMFVAILMCFLDTRVTQWALFPCCGPHRRKKLTVNTSHKLLKDSSTDTSGTKSAESGPLMSAGSDVTTTSTVSSKTPL